MTAARLTVGTFMKRFVPPEAYILGAVIATPCALAGLTALHTLRGEDIIIRGSEKHRVMMEVKRHSEGA
jgi:hypothetical protein